MSYAQIPQPVSYLANLSDVKITSVANGEVLTYDSTLAKWKNNPTSGLVTSVSNSDSTLTISPTTGAVVASINLGNANIWTAAQTFTQVIQTSQGGYVSNTAVGTGALASNNNTSNSALGYQALHANTSGNSNCAFGSQSLLKNTTGTNNSAFGLLALETNTTGKENCAFGSGALGNNTTANDNCAFGLDALGNNTTGPQNCAFGWNSCWSNTTGSALTGFGYYAMFSGTTHNNNCAFGWEALYSNTTGNNVCALGLQALYQFNDATAANDNIVAMGYKAGYNYTGAERNCILVGANVLGTVGESNVIRIGNLFVGRNDLLVGYGMMSEYASTLSTAVALGTGSTTIKTFTPLANGQHWVVISVEASVATTLTTLTVTYTDVTSGATTTQTLATNQAIGLNAAVTFVALCNASTTSAITISATALATPDLYASASILAL